MEQGEGVRRGTLKVKTRLGEPSTVVTEVSGCLGDGTEQGNGKCRVGSPI